MSLRLNTLKINDDACIIYNHTLLECIRLDKKATSQQEHELYAIANDCVYLQDISELI